VSRIDTGSQPSINRSPTTGPANKQSVSSAATPFAVRSNWQIRERTASQQKEKLKKNKRLTSTREVIEADIMPLSGKKRQQMVADITRLIDAINRDEEENGGDSVSDLCKSMLNEHLRRLMILPEFQTDSTGLKGTA